MNDVVVTIARAEPIAEVVKDIFGIAIRYDGGRVYAACPSGESAHEFEIWPDRNAWYCLHCAVGGDPVRFVQEKTGMAFPEAAAFLAATA